MNIKPEVIRNNGYSAAVALIEKKKDTWLETLKKIIYKPFRRDQIKTRKGRGGKTLSYVATADVIDRLNQTFSFKWSWHIADTIINEKEVIIRGILTATIDEEIISKEAYGGKDRLKNSSLTDDIKAAASDALKKASTLFGIGSHLYKS